MKKYAGGGYFGIQFDGTCAAPPAAAGAACTEIDGTQYGTLHIDVWTPDSTTVWVKLVDAGPDRLASTPADNAEGEVHLTLTPGQWTGLEITMTAIAAAKTGGPGAVTYANLFQLILSNMNGAGVVFLDNIYWHK